MRSLPNPLRHLGTLAVTAVAVAAIAWAGNNAGPGEAELAAVQDNGCSVTTGNGKVVEQPSAKCPVSIALSGPLSVPAQAAAPNMAPGDTVSRRLDITNDGKNTLDSIVMKAEPAASAISNSLAITVRRCTNSACNTTGSPLSGSLATGMNLGASPAKAKGGVDRLLVSVRLDPNHTVQNVGTTITYTFTATKN